MSVMKIAFFLLVLVIVSAHAGTIRQLRQTDGNEGAFDSDLPAANVEEPAPNLDDIDITEDTADGDTGTGKGESEVPGVTDGEPEIDEADNPGDELPTTDGGDTTVDIEEPNQPPEPELPADEEDGLEEDADTGNVTPEGPGEEEELTTDAPVVDEPTDEVDDGAGEKITPDEPADGKDDTAVDEEKPPTEIAEEPEEPKPQPPQPGYEFFDCNVKQTECVSPVLNKYLFFDFMEDQMKKRLETDLKEQCTELTNAIKCLKTEPCSKEDVSHYFDAIQQKNVDITPLSFLKYICDNDYQEFVKNKACVFNAKVQKKYNWCKSFLYADCSPDRMIDCLKPVLDLVTPQCTASAQNLFVRTLVGMSSVKLCEYKDPMYNCYGKKSACFYKYFSYKVADVYGNTYSVSKQLQLLNEISYDQQCRDRRSYIDCAKALSGTTCPANKNGDALNEAHYQVKCVDNKEEESKVAKCYNTEDFLMQYTTLCVQAFYSDLTKCDVQTLIKCTTEQAASVFSGDAFCRENVVKSVEKYYTNPTIKSLICPSTAE